MKRLAIAFFYDRAGIVDDYFPIFVKALRPFAEKTIFVSNGKLDAENLAKAESCSDEVIIRDNSGFDVWAYKAALEHVGFDALAEYDEVMLYNHTNFGPIFPFSEMFREMEGRDSDIWGITDHIAVDNHPYMNGGLLPWHINSHFVTVRKSILQTDSFRKYWQNMPMINSYVDSIREHETQFADHFIKLGFKASVYISSSDVKASYALMEAPDEMMRLRCPIFKRRMFFGTPLYLEEKAADAPRALRIIEQTSDYDIQLMWKNILRESKLRELSTNVALTSILPDVATHPKLLVDDVKIAVCGHIFYVDMLEEMLELTMTIPIPYDFIVTTDTAEKASEIEATLKGRDGISNVFVRVVEQNRGRDMSSLFITCRDFFLDDRYDYVCRIHSKKSPQVEASRGRYFKHHVTESLLSSRGYTLNLLNELLAKPWIGIAVAPLPHYSLPTMGHSWFVNKPKAIEICAKLALDVPLDDHTPVAVYGTNFWFRPKSLRKLFAQHWEWEDFDAEPNHVDGSLAHALERVICYTAQDAGFSTQHVMPKHLAELNYAFLEYKLSLFQSRIPLDTLVGQLRRLDHLQSHKDLTFKIRVAVRAPIRKLNEYGRKLRHRNPMIASLWNKIKG